MESSSSLQAPPGPDVRYAFGQCSYGTVLVAESRLGICAIALGDDPTELGRELRGRHPDAAHVEDEDFAAQVADVIAFVEAPEIYGRRPSDLGLNSTPSSTPSSALSLTLDLRGSAFQRRVWRALQEIPVGSTMTYAEVARHIGEPKAVRAVAQACAANVLAVVIPCHRVVRSDGGLSGYRWGVERKRALLAREQAATGMFATLGSGGGLHD